MNAFQRCRVRPAQNLVFELLHGVIVELFDDAEITIDHRIDGANRPAYRRPPAQAVAPAAQALPYRLEGLRRAFLKGQHIVAADDQANLVLDEIQCVALYFVAMQNEVEIILVGVEFLALRVIEDVLLTNGCRPKAEPTVARSVGLLAP